MKLIRNQSSFAYTILLSCLVTLVDSEEWKNLDNPRSNIIPSVKYFQIFQTSSLDEVKQNINLPSNTQDNKNILPSNMQDNKNVGDKYRDFNNIDRINKLNLVNDEKSNDGTNLSQNKQINKKRININRQIINNVNNNSLKSKSINEEDSQIKKVVEASNVKPTFIRNLFTSFLNKQMNSIKDKLIDNVGTDKQINNNNDLNNNIKEVLRPRIRIGGPDGTELFLPPVYEINGNDNNDRLDSKNIDNSNVNNNEKEIPIKWRKISKQINNQQANKKGKQEQISKQEEITRQEIKKQEETRNQEEIRKQEETRNKEEISRQEEIRGQDEISRRQEEKDIRRQEEKDIRRQEEINRLEEILEQEEKRKQEEIGKQEKVSKQQETKNQNNGYEDGDIYEDPFVDINGMIMNTIQCK
ncbi:unnamed protein product [Gordionus sp. m RMFG-2023]